MDGIRNYLADVLNILAELGSEAPRLQQRDPRTQQVQVGPPVRRRGRQQQAAHEEDGDPLCDLQDGGSKQALFHDLVPFSCASLLFRTSALALPARRSHLLLLCRPHAY